MKKNEIKRGKLLLLSEADMKRTVGARKAAKRKPAKVTSALLAVDETGAGENLILF